MKKLYLARHAKSSWDNPHLKDWQRPLLQAGIVKTAKIAGYIEKQRIHFDLIISSHAVRALETAKLLAPAAAYPLNDILTEPKIYEASEDAIYDVLSGVPDQHNSVLLVGHNPTFTYFINFYARPRIDNFPTSGFACISFETESWANISSASYKVEFIVIPKNL